MHPDFTSIEYLQWGNARQRAAFTTLTGHRLMERLAPFGPLLAGTIPIGVDVAGSDLDILCEIADGELFTSHLQKEFAREAGFHWQVVNTSTGPAVIGSFYCAPFLVEIFGQPMPVQQQRGWLHLLAEARLLAQWGEPLRAEVIRLKNSGMKTEPAFAQALGLSGDPYEVLLNF